MGSGSAGRRRLILAALAACAAIGKGALAAPETCAPDRVDIRTEAGIVSYDVEVVDTVETRARGLMFREELPETSGMLFVYDRAEIVAFWMKNTPRPLDIIYLNKRGIVCSIARDTVPFSEVPIPSGCAAQTVLEVNAGQATARGIALGAPLRHPAIAAPVWPCE